MGEGKRLVLSVVTGLGLVAGILGGVAPAHAQTEEDLRVLEMFYEDKDLVVTPSRDPKPISEVAENITVVTAREIEAINAHTLADVLNTITGVQIDLRGGPGTQSTPAVQGSDPLHVLVMIDGVAQNFLVNNSADVGAIPVQQIERIEIIKGPASSSWGSSLGGIINVITKSPNDERSAAGLVSTSFGERFTGDHRVELSGTVGGNGYYVHAGKLHSDGLLPNNQFDGNRAYGKFQRELPDGGSLQWTLGYSGSSRGDQQDFRADLSSRNRFDNLFSTFSFAYPVTERIDLDLSLRTSWKSLARIDSQLSTGLEQSKVSIDELTYGGSAKLTWRERAHHLAFGADFDRGDVEETTTAVGNPAAVVTPHLTKWALFANDTIAVGNLTVIPGVRYDHTSTNGDFASPSLGVTYGLGEHIVLRGAVARGFNIPPLIFTSGDGLTTAPSPGLKVEKVLSYQAGFETTLFRYFWLKSTLFRHDISDAIVPILLSNGQAQFLNQNRQRRQGVEVEVRTVPFFNTSIATGYAYVDARNRDTDEQLSNVASHIYNLALQYDDRNGLRGTLTGHYIWWNAASDNRAKYTPVVWDLNLTKRLFKGERMDAEAFFTAHNLFNGAQYLYDSLKNPRRWFEGGVRFRF
ncbi:TonB-dependent receptor [Geobacter sp.]|uniref:TonB-dependent receptor plug domain-containing protein n=1 Tax=Geobacter sp. TaxID=46610 RepID=UPI00262CEA34|nr:TonB-dependent receptor [Geobacter sp.]